VDLQHGLLDYSDMVPMLQALSITNTVPFVRVPWRDTWQIDRALDAGAMGVIVPLVNNREQAEEVVRAMKYPNNPVTPGIRSCGPVRSMGLYGSEHMERADDEIAVICQIETAEALENLEEIASCPGVDALYIGPTDLAFGLGINPAGGNRWWGSLFTHEDHIAAVKRVREVAQANGKAAIMHVLNSTEQSEQYLKDGFNGVMVGAARSWMITAAGKTRHHEPLAESCARAHAHATAAAGSSARVCTYWVSSRSFRLALMVPDDCPLAIASGGALRTLRKTCPTVIPPKITSSDEVLEALAAGKIDVAEAKQAMAKL
jgi:4-hydroxy-2-oxoheptanedioate aldolase